MRAVEPQLALSLRSLPRCRFVAACRAPHLDDPAAHIGGSSCSHDLYFRHVACDVQHVISLQRILVPFDGSPAALHALHEAAEIAERLGAELILLEVLEPASRLFPREITEDVRNMVRARLEETAAKLRAHTPRVRAMIAEGKPWEKIAELEKELDVDLLVMGTHGRSGLDRALLGSVAGRVIRVANAPVLTVPEHLFADRADAAARLLRELVPLGLDAPAVLALSREALPIASRVARGLSGTLDLCLVVPLVGDKKVLGAMGENGNVVLESGVVVSDDVRLAAEQAARSHIDLELSCLRKSRPMRAVEHHSIVAVTDGLASPATALVAAGALRALGPRELILAVPIASRATLVAVEPFFDRIVALQRTLLDDALAWYEHDHLPSEGKTRAQLAAGTAAPLR